MRQQHCCWRRWRRQQVESNREVGVEVEYLLDLAARRIVRCGSTCGINWHRSTWRLQDWTVAAAAAPDWEAAVRAPEVDASR